MLCDKFPILAGIRFISRGKALHKASKFTDISGDYSAHSERKNVFNVAMGRLFVPDQVIPSVALRWSYAAIAKPLGLIIDIQCQVWLANLGVAVVSHEPQGRP
jgi:hypothetical protein